MQNSQSDIFYIFVLFQHEGGVNLTQNLQIDAKLAFQLTHLTVRFVCWTFYSKFLQSNTKLAIRCKSHNPKQTTHVTLLWFVTFDLDCEFFKKCTESFLDSYQTSLLLWLLPCLSQILHNCRTIMILINM